MSIDWSVWIEPSYFSVRQLLDRTALVFATLLRGDHGSLTVYDDTKAFIVQPRSTLAPASQAFSDSACGTANEGFIVALADHLDDCAVSVGFIRLSEAIEDAEYGDWLYVSPFRTAPSYVLGIAVAIAAATLAGQTVTDDALLLGEESNCDPNDLTANLAAKTEGLPLVDAASSVLEKTKLSSPRSAQTS